jgi:hypothetical protein
MLGWLKYEVRAKFFSAWKSNRANWKRSDPPVADAGSSDRGIEPSRMTKYSRTLSA